MRSPLVEAAVWIDQVDKLCYSDLKVMHAPGGWYVGTTYTEETGYSEPGSRDSEYFKTREEAAAFLHEVEAGRAATRMTL